MYTIKRAAELTGIPVSTLRAWERRYAVVTPQRTDAGYRLYDDEAVRTLSLMKRLVREGWTPSLAAEELRHRRADLDGGAVLGPSAGSTSSTGRGEALAELDLVEPAEAMDATLAAGVLDEAFSRASFEVVVDEWLMPALRRLGEAWAEGRVSVAGEHLVAHAVQRRLAAMLEAAGGPTGDGPTVVLGLSAGARHELGLLAFAAAARRAGLATVYLGADLPPPDWVTALVRHRADAAVLAVPLSADVQPAREVVAALRSSVDLADADLLVAVGGAQQDLAPDGCLRLGHEIGAAARRLAQVLR